MAEREQLDKALRDLIQIMHFTQTVSAKIHGLPDEAAICRTVREEFAKSKRYTCSILLLTEDRSHLRIVEASLSPAQLSAGEELASLQLKHFRIDLDSSAIYSQVVREGRTLQTNVSDVIAELLPQPLASLISATLDLEGRPAILTPLSRHGEIIGAFGMSSTELADHFIPSVRNLAQHISAALELAHENARRKRAEEALQKAYDELETRVQERTAELTEVTEALKAEIAERRQAEQAVKQHRRDLQSLSAQLISAQEAERRRISQELHDEMGQALTAMSINLAAMEEELPSQYPLTMRERLAETRSLADRTLKQVRRLSLDLRPSMLDDLGLVPTLHWYVSTYTRRLNVEVEFEAIGLEERLPAEVETVLYRAVQEALTNVARHAQATTVRIRLERRDSTVTAFIEDNGRGFDVQEVAGREAPERGMGLLGMQERVTSLGGRFRIQSHPGQGTRLSIEIPLPP